METVIAAAIRLKILHRDPRAFDPFDQTWTQAHNAALRAFFRCLNLHQKRSRPPRAQSRSNTTISGSQFVPPGLSEAKIDSPEAPDDDPSPSPLEFLHHLLAQAAAQGVIEPDDLDSLLETATVPAPAPQTAAEPPTPAASSPSNATPHPNPAGSTAQTKTPAPQPFQPLPTRRPDPNRLVQSRRERRARARSLSPTRASPA